ncbi:MAG: RecX family transcriptional regulator [Clostridiales bacterium]|nr:RecX family transcriptional regulator [Clostridiales bacterium]
MKITDITVTKKGRFAVFVDGEFLFSAQEEALVRSGLRPGDETDIHALEELRRESEYIFGREYALHLLEYKAYSRSMLLQRLERYVDAEAAVRVADRLCELGLINDSYYASTYARDLFRLKGYSRQRIAQALRQKGIGREEIEEALAQFEDEDVEEKLYALVTGRYLRYLGDEKGRQKAQNALLRMGYRYGEIHTALRRAREEYAGQFPDWD